MGQQEHPNRGQDPTREKQQGRPGVAPQQEDLELDDTKSGSESQNPQQQKQQKPKNDGGSCGCG